MTKIIATTTFGKVQGVVGSKGIYAFLGIPYGANTAGARRFRPPVPPESWEGIYEANKYGPSCPQGKPFLPSEDHASIKGIDAPVNENCLVLNVWTSGVEDNGKRPVMVWLHGGGFMLGSGSHPLTNGENLAARGDVVVVSLNHRLSIYGFLFLEDICGSDFIGSGIAGILDIKLALEWVRDNIEAFGGDPKNVTLFGESGGGRKICVLMAMPSTRGLFHRAIIESGPHPRCISREVATRLATRFFEWLGLKVGDIEALQAIGAAKLFSQFNRFINKVEDPMLVRGQAGFWLLSPVIDGKILPDNPINLISKEALDIPIIIGTNKDEASIFLVFDKNAGALNEGQLKKRLVPMLGDHTEAIIDVYRHNRPEANPWDLLVTISSEDYHLLSIQMAEEKAKQNGAPVYMYLFTWESNYGLLKAAHTMEIPFIFQKIDHTRIVGTRPDRQRLADLMSDTWIAFARTGVPDNPLIPKWEPYDIEHRSTMIIDIPPRIENDPWRDERLAWNKTSVKYPWERKMAVEAIPEKKKR